MSELNAEDAWFARLSESLKLLESQRDLQLCSDAADTIMEVYDRMRPLITAYALAIRENRMDDAKRIYARLALLVAEN